VTSSPAIVVAPAVVDEEQPSDQAADEEPAAKFPPFAACYNDDLEGLPPSILRTLQDRLERKKYDLGATSPVVACDIQKAKASYLRKRESGRVRAAAKRAEKRAELAGAGASPIEDASSSSPSP